MEILFLPALMLTYFLPPLAVRWLAARCLLPREVRWEVAGWGAAWACFGAPIAWVMLILGNIIGGYLLLGDRSANALWARINAFLHSWPTWAHVALYGLPYLLICLASDWQWGRRNLSHGSDGEKSRVVLWALMANVLSFAWIVWLWCALDMTMD